MSHEITILLAGEFPAEQTQLRAVLAANPRFVVVGAVSHHADLLAKMEELQPQLIILDWDLSDHTIITTLVTLKEHNPMARVLVLTRRADDVSVFAAIKAGALGYLLSQESAELINNAIEAVARGESALSPLVARKLIRELHRPAQLPPSDEPLVDKEVEVIILVARGFSNREIAGMLTLDERTVRTYISNILSKLHLANRTQAGLWAQKEGLLDKNHFSPQLQRVQTLCHQLRGTLEGTLEGEPAFWQSLCCLP
ncbi:MAG: response regulator transcription factor [Caldilineaceae bacterium]